MFIFCEILIKTSCFPLYLLALCVVGRGAVKHNWTILTSEIAFICWSYFPQVSKQNRWNIYKIKVSFDNQYKPMPLFYSQGDHSHEYVIHLFWLYFSTFPHNMCNHVWYIILGLCFKIYINGIIVFISFCNTVFSLDHMISDLSTLVSRVLHISFNCYILANIFKFSLFIKGFCYQKINIVLSFLIYIQIYMYIHIHGYFLRNYDTYFCAQISHIYKVCDISLCSLLSIFHTLLRQFEVFANLNLSLFLPTLLILITFLHSKG